MLVGGCSSVVERLVANEKVMGSNPITRSRKGDRMPIPERVIIPASKDPGMGHFYVSLVKSALRIGAGGFLISGNLLVAGALFIVAEGLGIVEELV